MKIVSGSFLLLCLAGGATNAATADSTAREQIDAVMQPMQKAANAHDTDRFMAGFWHDKSLVFVLNGNVIRGWNELHAQQLKWWRNGKTDVVYTPLQPTQFQTLAPGVVATTQWLGSRRTAPDGKISTGKFAVTSIWKNLPQGWRIVYGHESWQR